MNTKSSIKYLLKAHNAMRVNELAELTGVSKQMIHRALLSLVEEEEVIKTGKAPKTFYEIARQVSEPSVPYAAVEKSKEDFLDQHYLLVTETGQRLEGVKAMQFWCERQKLPFEKTVTEYLATRKKYLSYFGNNQLIDGMEKLKNTKGFSGIGLDELYYLDFYAIERFGKTRLGTLLHFAKQGQNRKLMAEICETIRPVLLELIKKEKLEAVGYIPPTIKREVQFMKVLRQNLNLTLPHLNIVKVSGEIAVPQKALSKIEDRIANAKASLQPIEKRKFDRILLIDDAVGSGASMNETGRKLKSAGIAKKITALALTGSYKGFEVIQEI
ncbi:MAG: hypothetical protein ACT4ON_02270 [Bacteroidota bacterium]